MIRFLVKKFVKNFDNICDEGVRSNYGTLSSVVGIICNVLLFCAKFGLGILSNSIAIMSDAFNNLSDSASCIVTLFGYKLAAKPADKDHPFGHGRIEYIVSLIIALIILLVGVELFKSSFDKLLNPVPLTFSWVVVFLLILSILLKFWMSYFNKSLGTKINNSAMIATSKDSLNDVIATCATLVALIGSNFTTLPLDGTMGIVVSVFVFISGAGIIRSTVDDLIGQPVDKVTVDKIRALILSRSKIIGLHDLIIHNYGPGKMIGSVHVEIDCTEDLLTVHDLIDGIERQIEAELHIMMTIHMDPIQQDNQVMNQYKDMMNTILLEINPMLSMHDFRVVSDSTQTHLIFDVLIPYDLRMEIDEIKEDIDAHVVLLMSNVTTVITFDRGYY